MQLLKIKYDEIERKSLRLGEGTESEEAAILQEEGTAGISKLLFLGWKSPTTSKMEKCRIRELLETWW